MRGGCTQVASDIHCGRVVRVCSRDGGVVVVVAEGGEGAQRCSGEVEVVEAEEECDLCMQSMRAHACTCLHRSRLCCRLRLC